LVLPQLGQAAPVAAPVVRRISATANALRQWSNEFLLPQMSHVSCRANIVPQVYQVCQVNKFAVDCVSPNGYNLFFNNKKQKHKQLRKFSFEVDGVFAL
jgi:hypothetical protein